MTGTDGAEPRAKTEEPKARKLALPGRKIWGNRWVAFISASILCGTLLAGALTPAAALTSAFASDSEDLFNSLPDELTGPPLDQSSKVLAADGTTVLARFYTENRVPVTLDRISPSMQKAIVATEDARFYEHGALDMQGILRAGFNNLVNPDRQGASTLTQQYVKNVLIESAVASGTTGNINLGADRGLSDKIKEARLAVGVEKKYSKDEILDRYLNIVFFNANAYGVQAAARYYFGTEAKDLTIPESALLAGMVQNPALFDPVTHPAEAKARRNTVLGLMLAQGKITKAEHDKAAASKISLHITPAKQGCASSTMAPYFCSYVEHVITGSSAFGTDVTEREKLLQRGGLTIRTTLDPRLQRVAQQQVQAAVPASDPSGKGAALVTVQPGTGKILAMAQNTVYGTGQGSTVLNLSADQNMGGGVGFAPGSTMKPFTFAAWLADGHSMNEIVDASKRDYPAGYPWKASCAPDSTYFAPYDALQNDVPGYYRPMSVLYGLYQSINTATFASAAQLDLCDIQKMADAAGLHLAENGKPVNMLNPANFIGSDAVSPLTMAAAYATFASGGTYCTPVAITSITDSRKKQYPVPSGGCKQTMSPGVAAGVDVALQDVLKKGSGYQIPLDVPAGAKTGTSDYSSQTWTVGYTSGLATASWVGGYQDNGPMRDIVINGKFYSQVDGAYIAGPQWQHYMNKVAPLYSTAEFPQPPASMGADLGTDN